MPVIPLEYRLLIKILHTSYKLQARAIKRVLVSSNINGISLSGIQFILTKLAKHGSVKNLSRTGRPTTVCTFDKIQRAVYYIENKLGLVSYNNLARYLGISRTSAKRIIKNYLKLKCYKTLTMHHINPPNKEKRRLAAEYLLDNYGRKMDSIVFSDEAMISLGENLSNEHYRVWTKSKNKTQAITLNQNELIKTRFQFPQKFMVWVGVCSLGKLKPIFFPPRQTMNSSSYKTAVLDECFPEIDRLYQGKPWYFQQDNASVHTARNVLSYIRDKNVNLVTNYPPNSPDLSVCDYFLFGYLKNKIYSKPASTLADLKRRFLEEWDKLPLGILKKAIRQWPVRLGLVVQEKGGHIEHLLAQKKRASKLLPHLDLPVMITSQPCSYPHHTTNT